MAKFKRVSRRILAQTACMNKEPVSVKMIGQNHLNNTDNHRVVKSLRKQRDIDEGVRNGLGDGAEFGPLVPKCKVIDLNNTDNHRVAEEPMKIPTETGPFLDKKKKSGLTLIGVGLGVTVPIILLVVYHYEELTVTYNHLFQL